MFFKACDRIKQLKPVNVRADPPCLKGVGLNSGRPVEVAAPLRFFSSDADLVGSSTPMEWLQRISLAKTDRSLSAVNRVLAPVRLPSGVGIEWEPISCLRTR